MAETRISGIFAHDHCHGLRDRLTWLDADGLLRVRGVAVVDSDLDLPPGPYLAVYGGERPTPGYAFAFNAAKIRGRALELAFTWQAPASDEVLAQVISTPCAIFTIHPMDSFDEIHVSLDEAPFGTLSAPLRDQLSNSNAASALTETLSL